MRTISVTEETSQVSRGWLKEEASANRWDMSVTEETFQEEILPLKDEAPANIPDMLVTRERSGASVAL